MAHILRFSPNSAAVGRIAF